MKEVDNRINSALNSCKKDINLEKHKAYVEENYKPQKRFSILKFSLALSGGLCVLFISVYAIILVIALRPAMSADPNYVGLDNLTVVTEYKKTDFQEFIDYREFEFEIESKNLRQMIRKIKHYISFLNENPHYRTRFLKLGDGLAISVKKA